MQFIDETQRELNKLLWRYRPSKVQAFRHDIYRYGSQSIGLESQYKALIFVWINRIFKSSGWAYIANLYFGNVWGLKFPFRCYYSVELLPYIQVLLRYVVDTHVSQNEVYILWNNKCIQIGNNSVYYKLWYERGVVFIQNFCDIEGYWLSHVTFTEKYNISCDYQSILVGSKRLLETQSNFTIYI